MLLTLRNPTSELPPWAQVWSAVAAFKIDKIDEEPLVQVLRHARHVGVQIDLIRERFWDLESVTKKSREKGPESVLSVSNGQLFINEKKIGSLHYCYRHSLEPTGPKSIHMRRYLDDKFFEFSLENGVAILGMESIMVNYFQADDASDILTLWSKFCNEDIQKLPTLREWALITKMLQEKWAGRKVSSPRVGATIHYIEHAVAYLGALLGALRYAVNRMGAEAMKQAVNDVIKNTKDSLDEKYHGIFNHSLNEAEEKRMRFQIRKKGFQVLEGLPRSFWQIYTALFKLLKADENKLSKSLRKCLVRGRLVTAQQFPIELLKEGTPVIVDALNIGSIEEYSKAYPATRVHDSGACCVSCGKPESAILRRSERLLMHPRVVSQHVLTPDYIKECILCQAAFLKAKATIGEEDMVIKKIQSEPLELLSLSKEDKEPIKISLERLPLSRILRAYHSAAENLATEVFKMEDPFGEIVEIITGHSYELLSEDGSIKLDSDRLEILAKLYLWMMQKRINKRRHSRVIADVVKHVCQSFNLCDALYRVTVGMPHT